MYTVYYYIVGNYWIQNLIISENMLLSKFLFFQNILDNEFLIFYYPTIPHYTLAADGMIILRSACTAAVHTQLS